MSETKKRGNRGSEVEELADLSSFLLDALSSEEGQWGHEEKSETFGSFGDIRPGNTWKEEDVARSRIFIDSVSYPQLQLNQMYHREVHLTVPLVSFLLISLSTVLPPAVTDAEPASRRRRANKLIPGPTAPKGKLLSREFTLSTVFFPERNQYRHGSTSTGSADHSLCHTIGLSNRTHFRFVIREYFNLLDL